METKRKFIPLEICATVCGGWNIVEKTYEAKKICEMSSMPFNANVELFYAERIVKVHNIHEELVDSASKYINAVFDILDKMEPTSKELYGNFIGCACGVGADLLATLRKAREA